MTVKIQIDITGQPTRHIVANDSSLEAIRFTFNPSLNDDVTQLKALAAAFLTKCDNIARLNPAAGRECSVAKTSMQTASMWAVLGATKINNGSQSSEVGSSPA
jgi:hypothetical protein